MSSAYSDNEQGDPWLVLVPGTKEETEVFINRLSVQQTELINFKYNTSDSTDYEFLLEGMVCFSRRRSYLLEIEERSTG